MLFGRIEITTNEASKAGALNERGFVSSKSRLIRATIAFALLAMQLGCKQNDEVRVGFLADPLSELGMEGRNGAQLAVDTLNARHSIHYDLAVENDQNNPAVARAAAASFASRGTAFVVGPMTSTVATALVPQTNGLGLVLISPTATTPELTGKKDFFFRTAADGSMGARQLSRFLHDQGAQRIVVVIDSTNNAYSLSFGRAAAAEFLSLGGLSAPLLSYQSGNSLDFAQTLGRLASACTSAEAVVIVSDASDAAIVARHLRRVAPRVIISLSPWAANARFVLVGGAASEGVIALRAVDVDSPLPRMRDFVVRYRARFGHAPSTPAVQSYEAVMLGADGVQRRGVGDLQTALSVPRMWDGLDGTYPIDAYGDIQRPLHLTQVSGGDFHAIRPAARGPSASFTR